MLGYTYDSRIWAAGAGGSQVGDILGYTVTPVKTTNQPNQSNKKQTNNNKKRNKIFMAAKEMK